MQGSHTNIPLGVTRWWGQRGYRMRYYQVFYSADQENPNFSTYRTAHSIWHWNWKTWHHNYNGTLSICMNQSNFNYIKTWYTARVVVLGFERYSLCINRYANLYSRQLVLQRTKSYSILFLTRNNKVSPQRSGTRPNNQNCLCLETSTSYSLNLSDIYLTYLSLSITISTQIP